MSELASRLRSPASLVVAAEPVEAHVSRSDPGRLEVTLDDLGKDVAYLARWQKVVNLPVGTPATPPVGTPCLVVLTPLSCWILAFEGWPA